MDENNQKSQLNQSVFDLFRESFVKVCTESTSHGLPNVFKTKNWLIRILWLVLFLAGSGGALYCTNVLIFILKINKKINYSNISKDTIVSIMDYLAYPASVTVETSYESPTKFPSITICKLLQFFNLLNFALFVHLPLTLFR